MLLQAARRTPADSHKWNADTRSWLLGDRPAWTSLIRRLHLVEIDGMAALNFTASAGPRDAVLRPLGDQPPLEMRDGAEYVEDQLPGGR